MSSRNFQVPGMIVSHNPRRSPHKKICPRTNSSTISNRYTVFRILSSNTAALRVILFVPTCYHKPFRSSHKTICPCTNTFTLLNQYAVFRISSNTTALRVKLLVLTSYLDPIWTGHTKRIMLPYKFFAQKPDISKISGQEPKMTRPNLFAKNWPLFSPFQLSSRHKSRFCK